MTNTSLESALRYNAFSLSPEYSIHGMGLAYVTPDGNANVVNSDRPQTHVREAQYMDDIVKDYLRSEEGQQFVNYALSHGRKFLQLVGAGSADLGEHTVAALIHDGEKGLIVSNYDGKDFRSRVDELADMYHISSDAALEYVLTHEFAHAAGNYNEESNELFLKEYFAHRAEESEGAEKEKYEKLAKIAERREGEAAEMGK